MEAQRLQGWSSYYNTASDRHVIDANGGGTADHYIGVKGVASMKADYFLH